MRSKFNLHQPLSLTGLSLTGFSSRSYWVCEKSDGVRVLFLLQTLGDELNVYLVSLNFSYAQASKGLSTKVWPVLLFFLCLLLPLHIEINRHNQYYRQEGFYFPHYEDPRRPLRSTILDGELVLDRDPRNGRVRSARLTVIEQVRSLWNVLHFHRTL